MQLINKILTELEDPTNREIVNDGQDYFEVSYTKTNISKIDDIFFDFDSMEIMTTCDYLTEPLKLFVIRHSINLLPCFEEARANTYVYIANIEEELRFFAIMRSLDLKWANGESVTEATRISKTPCTYRVSQGYFDIASGKGGGDYFGFFTHLNPNNFKTIRQALLCSGAMTLEDLEQGYLQLIK